MSEGAKTTAGRYRATVAEALEQLPEAGGERFAKVLEHGSMEVEVYAPRGQDLQTPHARDELYVVVRGSGDFVNGPERHPFGPGDVLFVPAGVEHRFEDFTDDFVTWVVFYGPEGGEAEPRCTGWTRFRHRKSVDRTSGSVGSPIRRVQAFLRAASRPRWSAHLLTGADDEWRVGVVSGCRGAGGRWFYAALSFLLLGFDETVVDTERPVRRARGPAARGGRRILEEARKLAVRTRAAGLELATATDNLSAQRLYESLGWERDTDFHHYSLSV